MGLGIKGLKDGRAVRSFDGVKRKIDIASNLAGLPTLSTTLRSLVFSVKCWDMPRWIAAALALSALWLVAPVSARSETCASEGNMDQIGKCHAINLLKKIRVALDTGAVVDPKKLHEITGIEMLGWHPANETFQFHRAYSWRFNDPVLDDKSQAFGKGETDELRYSFGKKRDDSFPANLSFMDFTKLACVTVPELTAIFGSFDIKTSVKPRPFHSPWIPPYRTLASTIKWKLAKGQINMFFEYESEKNPVPTCLKVLTISVVADNVQTGKVDTDTVEWFISKMGYRKTGENCAKELL